MNILLCNTKLRTLHLFIYFRNVNSDNHTIFNIPWMISIIMNPSSFTFLDILYHQAMFLIHNFHSPCLKHLLHDYLTFSATKFASAWILKTKTLFISWQPKFITKQTLCKNNLLLNHHLFLILYMIDFLLHSLLFLIAFNIHP